MVESSFDHLKLSQGSFKGDDCGLTQYRIIISCKDNNEEVLFHDYCSYHPQAGPVRPDAVTNLQLIGRNVTWEWSENSFDLASAGAIFQRPLATNAAGMLTWAGPVVRTAKEKDIPKPPNPAASSMPLLPRDLVVEDEYISGFNDDVKVHVTHARSNTKLTWDSKSDAESQSIRLLKTTAVKDGMVRIDFTHYMAESGSSHTVNMSLFVQLRADGIAWAQGGT
mmetsp:Transcript_19655/g.41096  ORF Transcript_19655/g.41096 Transcript_19655/m.41096 type:complete len:223 (-) Transcript_19655:216-884(-)|eukprot:CAMPEP_0118645362 /NCGR_PEP_ID=MMETSP0785-20121206/7460_1 /TAXON_ID=91992 /ORGANISM="Bolidomonas pacifica, Strain CCMP 1866" /LENGTH=222 /DNA_ID=CAMNT_0006537239 /DNA_START=167 /DNA_END=835 /DNA_ORIENTATION=-